MERIQLVHECTRCEGPIKKAPNLIGGMSTWFMICTNDRCKTIVNAFFEPTDYQLDYMADIKKIIGYFGGYGAGKTASTAIKAFLHLILVTNGEFLLGAAT